MLRGHAHIVRRADQRGMGRVSTNYFYSPQIDIFKLKLKSHSDKKYRIHIFASQSSPTMSRLSLDLADSDSVRVKVFFVLFLKILLSSSIFKRTYFIFRATNSY